jgi:hypothetical protein
MPALTRNQYDTLLEHVLHAHETGGTPPTIVVYNAEHMGALRAGMSRAKDTANILRSFMGESSLDSLQFKYSRDKERPGLVTITLEPAQRFQIEYLTEGVHDGTATTEIPNSLGDTQAPG